MTKTSPVKPPAKAPEPVTTLGFVRLKPEAQLPVNGSEQAVGYDLFAYLISETGRAMNANLPPFFTRMIDTGIAVLPPSGYWAAIYSRSGLALKSIWVANAPGVIDPDYTGEIRVMLYNGSGKNYSIAHGDRIAQLILHKYKVVGPPIELTREALPETARGTNGWGSTGR